MKIKLGDSAVSEIIGAIFLLAMAISVFSVVYINVLSDTGPDPNANATIIGKIENGHPVFEFQRGEGVGLDSKVYFFNNGSIFNMTTVENLIKSNDNSPMWDIGEKLFCPFSVPGKEIKATIYDSNTNELVWWGILQEGGILGKLGAIWHFNETNGTIAYDSLNDNDGTLYGPEWNTSIKKDGNSSLEFNGIDYVHVMGDSYSLNYIKNLSVEAYFKFTENPFIPTTMSFGDPFGYQPHIININDNVYAVTYGNVTNSKGFVDTINIFPNGTGKTNDQLLFDDDVHWPILCQISGEVYIVAYANSDKYPSYTTLKTLRIVNDGTIYSLDGNFVFGFKEVSDHKIIKISDNHTALVYRSNSDSGMIKTINITDNGNTISDYPGDGTYEFEENLCFEPDIIPISGNIYAIVYGNHNGDGIIKTVNITPDGVIHKPFIDSFIFDSINGTINPDIKLVSNNTYVIAYSDDNEEIGLLATVRITDKGDIRKVIDTFVFEKQEGKNNPICIGPKIIHMTNDYFVIAYTGKKHLGNVAIVKIEKFGSINHTFLLKFTYEGSFSFAYEADILRITDNVFVSAFRTGNPQEGDIRTFLLSDVIDFNSQPTNCGIIYKQDTWSIYVNQTHIGATINNTNFPMPYTWDNSVDWNHLIMTYNGSHLEVWCNGIRVISKDYNYNIYGTNLDKYIHIGESFRGFIDEVSIYDEIIIK